VTFEMLQMQVCVLKQQISQQLYKCAYEFHCLNTNSPHAGRGPLEKLAIIQLVKKYPTSTEFVSDPCPEPEDIIYYHPTKLICILIFSCHLCLVYQSFLSMFSYQNVIFISPSYMPCVPLSYHSPL
jgi:hypothetical protein